MVNVKPLEHVWVGVIYKMKQAPLKNKQKYYLDAVKIHHDDDIKSAVEWLKEDINTRDIPKGKKLILELIDKAFEDVVSKWDVRMKQATMCPYCKESLPLNKEGCMCGGYRVTEENYNESLKERKKK